MNRGRSRGEPPEVAVADRLGTTAWADMQRTALDPGLSSDALAQLAGHPSFAVRAAVALHPRTDPATRDALAGDRHLAVRLAVARGVARGTEFN